MNGTSRALATLLAAAAGGFGLWLAGHFSKITTGGYWAALGVVALAGLLLGIAQLRGRGGNPTVMFFAAFLPVLIAGGWVLVAMEPHANWFRDQIRAWDRDIGFADVVHYIGFYVPVVAFAIGAVFAQTWEPFGSTRRRTVAIDQAAADAPLTAERQTVIVEEAAVEHEVTSVK
jgi:hypothetical protein